MEGKERDPRGKKGEGKLEKFGLFAGFLLLFFFMGNESLKAGIRQGIRLFSPLLFGGILAMIYNVPVSAVERQLTRHRKGKIPPKVRRFLAILVSVVLSFGVIFGVLFLILPKLMEAGSMLADILAKNPELLEEERWIAMIQEQPIGKIMEIVPVDTEHLSENISQWMEDRSSRLAEDAVTGLQNAAGIVMDIGFGLVFAVYILNSKETLKKQVGRLLSVWLPQEGARQISHSLFICFRTFRNFLIGQSVEAVILGSLCGGGMFLLGIPYAATIGTLVGVTALIPMVGGVIGALVGVVLLLTVSPGKTLLFFIFLMILQQVEGNIIYPKIVGARIKLPPLWVLAAVVIGGNAAGPVGMFLGVPIFSSVYAFLKEATKMRELQKAAGEL